MLVKRVSCALVMGVSDVGTGGEGGACGEDDCGEELPVLEIRLEISKVQSNSRFWAAEAGEDCVKGEAIGAPPVRNVLLSTLGPT